VIDDTSPNSRHSLRPSRRVVAAIEVAVAAGREDEVGAVAGTLTVHSGVGLHGQREALHVAPASRERTSVPMRPGVESPSVTNTVLGSSGPPRCRVGSAGETSARPSRVPGGAVVGATPYVVVDHDDTAWVGRDDEDVVDVVVRDLPVTLCPRSPHRRRCAGRRRLQADPHVAGDRWDRRRFPSPWDADVRALGAISTGSCWPARGAVG